MGYIAMECHVWECLCELPEITVTELKDALYVLWLLWLQGNSDVYIDLFYKNGFQMSKETEDFIKILAKKIFEIENW